MKAIATVLALSLLSLPVIADAKVSPVQYERPAPLIETTIRATKPAVRITPTTTIAPIITPVTPPVTIVKDDNHFRHDYVVAGNSIW